MRSVACASPSRPPTWRSCWPSCRRCKNRALPAGLAVFGEIGLTGEIRPSPRGQERLREAVKLGFGKVIAPRANAP